MADKRVYDWKVTFEDRDEDVLHIEQFSNEVDSTMNPEEDRENAYWAADAYCEGQLEEEENNYYNFYLTLEG